MPIALTAASAILTSTPLYDPSEQNDGREYGEKQNAAALIAVSSKVACR